MVAKITVDLEDNGWLEEGETAAVVVVIRRNEDGVNPNTTAEGKIAMVKIEDAMDSFIFSFKWSVLLTTYNNNDV